MSLGGAVQTLTTEDLEKDDDEDNFEIYEKDTAWLPSSSNTE